MNKALALFEVDRALMHRLSDRTIASLRSHNGVRLLWPLLQGYVTANVAKEVTKDRAVIEDAAASFAAGEARENVDAAALLEHTKTVDKAFVREISPLPVKLVLDYTEIAPLRAQRIDRLIAFVYRVLGEWQGEQPISEVLRASFTPRDLHSDLFEIVDLYSQETRLVGRSAKLRGPARFASHAVGERIFSAMSAVADAVVAETVEQTFNPSESALPAS